MAIERNVQETCQETQPKSSRNLANQLVTSSMIFPGLRMAPSHGDIEMRPNYARATGDKVTFSATQ